MTKFPVAPTRPNALMMLFTPPDQALDPARDANAAREADRGQFASALARYITARREQLGLCVECAAERSGLKVFQWEALEHGWIPKQHSTMRLVAEVLGVDWKDVVIMAMFSACAQQS